jgi:O-antigen ligase
MAIALVLTPVVLLADVWGSSAFAPYRDRPAALAAGGVAGLALVAVGAVVLGRRPTVFVLLVAATLPFRVPITIGGARANLLVPLYVVLAAGSLAYVVRAWRAPPADASRSPGPVEWTLAATLVVYALQATYSSDVGQAVQHLAFFYVPFALLFVLLVRVEWTPRLLAAAFGVLAALAVLNAAIALVEVAVRDVLWNDKLRESNTYNSYFRANALFYDPNILGRFLVVVMALAASAVAAARGRREVAAGGLLLAVLFAGLVTTLSQSSFIALLVALAVVVALAGYARLVAVAAAACAVAGVVVLLAAPGAVGLHSDSGSALRKATSGRTDLVRGGADLFGERPVVGFGSGSFEHEYRERHRQVDRDVSASHTTPLTIAAEQGLPGLALYLVLLVVAFRVLVHAAGRDVARIAVAAAFAALVAHTLVYAAFLEDPLTWALLAVGVALAALPGPAGARAAPGRRQPSAATA